MSTLSNAIVRVDIVSAILNGADYVSDLLRSIQAQSHSHWQLWVRDDGSVDDTIAIVTAFAAADDRIRLLHRGGPPMGVAGAYGWLLQRLPADSRYVMYADHDDVWLPRKIESTLAAMRAAEAEAPGPVLVHTDLVVVDKDLRKIHESFWTMSAIDPERVTLRRLIVRNVVTAPASMLNRDLCDRMGIMPTDAHDQDWWSACVAVAFGRIIALREATILYRQHGHNSVGAKRDRMQWHEIPRAAVRALSETAHLRLHLARTARQAAAFLDRYEAELTDDDCRFLREYSHLPDLPFFRRKLQVVRLRLRRDLGFWRNLGVLLRA